MNMNNWKIAHDEIDHIFEELLPSHGMAVRQGQLKLSHTILDTMLTGKIALCDAGTGIGKTYAYLVAGIVYSRSLAREGHAVHPIIVSTSSIALQNAVCDEYLPFLSAALMEDKMLQTPIQAVIRKGKHHYVCDQRLDQRLRQANMGKKNPQAAQALISLKEGLDLDLVPHLSHYDAVRVCVPQRCDCNREYCRYRHFSSLCDSGRFLFQICNHNLLLADAIHHGSGRKPILPVSAALVVDEAHKLPETAREMFGTTLTASDIQTLIRSLRAERYLLAADSLSEMAAALLKLLSIPPGGDLTIEDYTRKMVGPDRTLSVIREQLGSTFPATINRELEQVSRAVSLFLSPQSDMIFYTAEDDHGGTMLCATVSDLTTQLKDTLWDMERPILLTSGTLAVGNDFHRFKEEMGLERDVRVQESVSLSPFQYQENCLLFLPGTPPMQRASTYFDDLAEQIREMLTAAHGHALVLFTSYAAMSAVRERLKRTALPFPLYTMGRNAVHTMERFKEDPGSVLLATGAAWEGFDFPGDCVSLLIIPRLPFAYPDALQERKREEYPSLHKFIRDVVVPEMQIKLKQGFGRAIRLETDSCVIAILDERASRGKRYHHDVLAALPKMPVTDSLQMVDQFMRQHKNAAYFQEGSE